MGKHLTSYTIARDFLRSYLKAATGFDCHQIELIPSEEGGPDTIFIVLHAHLQNGVNHVPNPIGVGLSAYANFIAHFGRCPYVIDTKLAITGALPITSYDKLLRPYLMVDPTPQHLN